MTWILPRNLPTSACAPDTEALISDSNVLSQICEQSLLVRSKVSPARTWSQKWKRDSWTQHLFGRILKHSHTPSFLAEWISSLEATPASPSHQPESDLAKTTLATCGRGLQMELLQCDQISVSLKTSRDISQWACPTLSKTWDDWVIEQRGAYSQRANAALLIAASESLSWPTAAARDWKGCSPNSHTRKDGRSRCYLLPEAVNAVEMGNWPTPQAQDTQRTPEAYAAAKKKRGGKMFLSLNIAAQLHGLPAPASHSSDGSRQGLSWPTPQTMDVLPVRPVEQFSEQNRTRGGRKNRMALSNLREAVHSPVYQQAWTTPRAGKTTDENPATWALRQAAGAVATMPLTLQVKAWATPQAKDHKSGHRDASIVQYKQLNVEVEAASTGKLNPRWVETLMGLPVGWTMPSCRNPVTIELTNSGYSETELSPPQQPSLSELSFSNS